MMWSIHGNRIALHDREWCLCFENRRYLPAHPVVDRLVMARHHRLHSLLPRVYVYLSTHMFLESEWHCCVAKCAFELAVSTLWLQAFIRRVFGQRGGAINSAELLIVLLLKIRRHVHRARETLQILLGLTPFLSEHLDTGVRSPTWAHLNEIPRRVETRVR